MGNGGSKEGAAVVLRILSIVDCRLLDYFTLLL